MSEHETETQTIPQDKFLWMCVNLLHKVFLEPSRTQAKKVYRQLEEGRTLHLTELRMEDRSTVRVDLSLDYSEYPGKLNFRSFHDSLSALLARLAQALRTKRDIPVFSAEHDKSMLLFGVTGVTQKETTPSVMVLGADSGGGQPQVTLKLMYLDHRQFIKSEVAAGAPGDNGVGDPPDKPGSDPT